MTRWQLSEIIRAVLEVLRDNPAVLNAAIRVSRTRFSAGVDLLWRQPATSALHCVAPARR